MRKNTPLTFERLENRMMLTGTEQSTAVPLLQENMSAAIGDALLQDRSWTDTELTAAVAKTLPDPSVAALGVQAETWTAVQTDLAANLEKKEYLDEVFAQTMGPLTTDQAQQLQTDGQALNALAASIASTQEVLTETQEAFQQAVDQLVADPPALEDPKATDTLALGSGYAGAAKWSVDLPTIGGYMQILSPDGQKINNPTAASVLPADTASLRRAILAASVTPQQITQTATIAPQISATTLPFYRNSVESFPSYASITVPGVGSMILKSDLPDRSCCYPNGYGMDKYQGTIICSRPNYNKSINTYEMNGDGGKMTVTFPGGSQYVRWINLSQFSPDTCGYMIVTLQNGTQRKMTLGASGPVIIDDVIQSFSFQGGTSMGCYGLSSINTTRDAQPPSIPGGTWLQCTGSAATVDLSAAKKCVDTVSFDVKSDTPGNVVTAYAYRGTTCIATQVVGQNGHVSIANEQGITAIILRQTDSASNIFIGNVALQAWNGQSQPATTLLSAKENRDFGMATAPNWLDLTPAQASTVAKANCVQMAGGTMCASNIIVNWNTGTAIDTTKYQRHEVRSANGAYIYDMAYLNQYGLQPLPHSYYEFLSGSTIVTYPGCPKYLVFRMAGTPPNRYFSGSTFTLNTSVQSGMTRTDVMPPAGMALAGKVDLIQAPKNTEGWCPLPEKYSSKGYPVDDPQTVNVFSEIQNDGLGSGACTIRFHVGQSGTLSDPVLKVLTGNLGGISTQGLSANVPVTKNDRVLLEIIDATGKVTTALSVTHPSRPSEMSSADYNAAMASRRGEKLLTNINTALQSASPQIAAYWTSLNTSYAYQSSTRAAAQSIVANAVAQEIEDTDPTKTTDDVLIKTKTYIAMAGQSTDGITTDTIDGHGAAPEPMTYEQLIAAYDPTIPPLPGVRTDSAMGRIYTTLAQKLLPLADRLLLPLPRPAITNDSRFLMAKETAEGVAAITGIDAREIMLSVDNVRHFEKIEEAQPFVLQILHNLFTSHQYTDLFNTTFSAAPNSVIGSHLEPPPSGTAYRDGDSLVLHFDFASPDFRYFSGNAYLVDGTGKVYPTPLLAQNFKDTNIVKIPVSSVAALLPGPASYDDLIIKLALFDQSGDTSGMQGAFRTEGFNLETSGSGIGDYSTLPATPENADRRAAENAILTEIANNFVVKNPGEWRWEIGSWYHDGRDMNAVDLNWGSDGNADAGKPVYAIADGTVVRNDTDNLGNSVFIVKHTATINGQTKEWYAKYLHMQNIGSRATDGTVSPLKVNDLVKGGDQIAEVGNVTNTGYHLHFQALENLSSNSIDLRRVLTDSLHLTVNACDAGPDNVQRTTADDKTLNVTWDDQFQAFSNSSEGVYLDRSEQVNDVPEDQSRCHWMAMAEDPAQRYRVIFAHALPDGHIVDAWYSTDYTKKWNSSSRLWENI